jgi:hypothetical protein
MTPTTARGRPAAGAEARRTESRDPLLEGPLLNPDFRDMLRAFCEEKVEFLLVGAYALAAHGFPRATGDMNLWIRCSDENARRAWSALIRFGAPLDGVSESDFRAAGIVFRIGVAPREIDIHTSIEAVEFERAWRNRVEVDVDGVVVPVIGRDDFVRNKRALGRPQDLADVQRLAS